MALDVEARRVLGESAHYQDGDVAAAVGVMLRKLATGEHESPEYRQGLCENKTVELLAVAEELCGKSPEDVNQVRREGLRRTLRGAGVQRGGRAQGR